MYSWLTNSLLRFHPGKCYSINIHNKSKQHCHHNYKMNNKDLEKKSVIKDLGIILDDNLRFWNHIINKVNKANQIMGKNRRTMVHLNKHNFILLYKSLVLPHLEYGNVVWSPFLESDITLIENFQRKTTRYAPDINKLEYQEWLEALNLPTLQCRRFRADMIKTYKITHGYFEENCVKHLFEMKSTNARGHLYAIKIRYSNTTIRRNYSAFLVASVWNSLSSDIVGLVFLNVFIKKLDNHCLTRNIVFDVNYDFLNAYALSTLLKWPFAIVSFKLTLIIIASCYASS